MDSGDRRLDRIEAKLDKVADALESLARTEEKILAMNGRLNVVERKMEAGYSEHVKLIEAAKDQHMTSMIVDRIVLRLDAMENLVNEINLRAMQSSMVTSTLERGLWVVFTAAVGVVAYMLEI